MEATEAPTTKGRILDTAEALFAEQGFDATSLRSITGAAEVNLAAVHYHFGSKAGLIEAVFSRRIGPLNARRLEVIDALEAREEKPTVEELIEAFVAPPIRAMAEHALGGPRFVRLLGRTLTEPNEEVRLILFSQFRPLVDRLMPAMARALPGIDRTDLCWRFHFMIGAMAHTMCDAERLEFLSDGRCRLDDPEDAVRRLVTFLAAGFRAGEET